METIIIGKVDYEVVQKTTLEEMAAQYPAVAKNMGSYGATGEMYVKRPNGSKFFHVVTFKNGGVSRPQRVPGAYLVTN